LTAKMEIETDELERHIAAREHAPLEDRSEIS
jgi:hypothetical protein